MMGTATVMRADARRLPLGDASVDVVVTSPPYWNLREYRDNGRAYDGQIGNEPTPWEYLDNLIECTAEWLRVLKPGGSLFVNLGDVYANRATPHRPGSSDGATGRADRPGRRSSSGTGVRAKSLYGLPARYALRCVDELGLIWRRDQIWHKASPMPESVTDRTRSAHEYVQHLVREPDYYAAMDRIREPHARGWTPGKNGGHSAARASLDGYYRGLADSSPHPLGALPGSVWKLSAEPLVIPDHIAHHFCCGGIKREGCEDGIEHHAAFPTKLPRHLILGWCPLDICTACGEGRRPVSVKEKVGGWTRGTASVRTRSGSANPGELIGQQVHDSVRVTIVGEECACPDASAPTRPAVVLDPMGGSGTTALTAKALGCHGITVDMSSNYCFLAEWRVNDPGQLAKAAGRPKPAPQVDNQADLLDDLLEAVA